MRPFEGWNGTTAWFTNHNTKARLKTIEIRDCRRILSSRDGCANMFFWYSVRFQSDLVEMQHKQKCQRMETWIEETRIWVRVGVKHPSSRQTKKSREERSKLRKKEWEHSSIFQLICSWAELVLIFAKRGGNQLYFVLGFWEGSKGLETSKSWNVRLGLGPHAAAAPPLWIESRECSSTQFENTRGKNTVNLMMVPVECPSIRRILQLVSPSFNLSIFWGA